MGLLNGDGDPDLVLCDTGTESLRVLIGDGIGGFNPGAVIAGIPATEVAVVDLGGPTNAHDVIAQVGDDLIVFTNDGAAAFP